MPPRPVRVLMLALCAAVLGGPVLASTGAGPDASVRRPPDHAIGVRVVDGQGELYDRRTGERFLMRGANYVFRETPRSARPPEIFRVGTYDGARVRRDFRRLADHGYDTVRVFLDHCDPQDAGCIGGADGPGLNADYLANVADLLEAARGHDLFVLPTSNDLPDHRGY